LASNDDADRDPDDGADDGRDRRLPRDGAGQLALSEAERFQQGEVPASAVYRCHEREAEADDRSGRKSAGEEDWGRADASIVHDLRRGLDPEKEHAVAARCVAVVGKDPVCLSDDPLHVIAPCCGTEPISEADEDEPGTVQNRISTMYRFLECRRDDLFGKECPGTHGCVVSKEAFVPYGGKVAVPTIMSGVGGM
jgi:hypothetical protein